ncbi:hypothetical protein QOT17_013042 [Balamuthia mandrillaris]
MWLRTVKPPRRTTAMMVQPLLENTSDRQEHPSLPLLPPAAASIQRKENGSREDEKQRIMKEGIHAAERVAQHGGGDEGPTSQDGQDMKVAYLSHRQHSALTSSSLSAATSSTMKAAVARKSEAATKAIELHEKRIWETVERIKRMSAFMTVNLRCYEQFIQRANTIKTENDRLKALIQDMAAGCMKEIRSMHAELQRMRAQVAQIPVSSRYMLAEAMQHILLAHNEQIMREGKEHEKNMNEAWNRSVSLTQLTHHYKAQEKKFKEALSRLAEQNKKLANELEHNKNVIHQQKQQQKKSDKESNNYQAQAQEYKDEIARLTDENKRLIGELEYSNFIITRQKQQAAEREQEREDRQKQEKEAKAIAATIAEGREREAEVEAGNEDGTEEEEDDDEGEECPCWDEDADPLPHDDIPPLSSSSLQMSVEEEENTPVLKFSSCSICIHCGRFKSSEKLEGTKAHDEEETGKEKEQLANLALRMRSEVEALQGDVDECRMLQQQTKSNVVAYLQQVKPLVTLLQQRNRIQHQKMKQQEVEILELRTKVERLAENAPSAPYSEQATVSLIQRLEHENKTLCELCERWKGEVEKNRTHLQVALSKLAETLKKEVEGKERAESINFWQAYRNNLDRVLSNEAHIFRVINTAQDAKPTRMMNRRKQPPQQRRGLKRKMLL